MQRTLDGEHHERRLKESGEEGADFTESLTAGLEPAREMSEPSGNWGLDIQLLRRRAATQRYKWISRLTGGWREKTIVALPMGILRTVCVQVDSSLP